jgi:pyruvate dehydrogenase E2 component (dihydrolipoamide acetyltransferase)
MPDVSMPRLSDSMEEGTILKWLKSSGDEVKRGEELVEIETDKANMTYEADLEGPLEIVAEEGDTLPVGATIARIGGGDGPAEDGKAPVADEEAGETAEAEQPAETEAEAGAEEEGEREEQPEPAAEETQPAPDDGAPATKVSEPETGVGEGNGRIKASPVARRMARELGLSLSDVSGSGPGGRIVKADVEAAAKTAPQREAPAEEAAPAAPEEPAEREVPPAVVAAAPDGATIKGEVETREPTRVQQTIARRMAESKATAPDFVLEITADMSEAVELRGRLKELAAEDEPVPSFNDFVIKAAALALREFPRANGAYRDGKFELYSRINVGMAVAGQDALIVPTVFDADRKSLGEIARDSRALAERVRAGAITPPELSGGTFTVSNLGMYGITRFAAVINPPQAAILAVGAMEPRPVVRDGEVVVRTQMDLTLACDHRILYGADAAQFLARVKDLLESPLKLAL